MKKIFSLAFIVSVLFSSCKQLKLENEEAEGLVKKSLELPKTDVYSVGWGPGVSMFGASGPLDALQKEELITYEIEYHGAFSDPTLTLTPTDKGQPFLKGNNENVYKFKTNEIDFDKILGISINKENQTATVRFTLKATNITPIATALKKEGYIKHSLNNPFQGELIYKKFDTGWQLQSNSNKSSSEMVKEIIKNNN